MRREEIQQAFVAACNPRNLPHCDQEDEPTSCLSTELHDETVEDAVQHYFGCLEISRRADFLKPEHPHWRHERNIQREKYQLELSQMRAKYLSNTDKSNAGKSNADTFNSDKAKTNSDTANINQPSANEPNANNSKSDDSSADNSNSGTPNTNGPNRIMPSTDRPDINKSKWESYLRDIQDKIKEAGHVVPVDAIAVLNSLSPADADLLLQKLVDERANAWLEKRMGSVAIAIEAQYKRIRVLRNALSKTRVTLPTPGLLDLTLGRKKSQTLELAFVYLNQWDQWDKNREQEHNKDSQRKKPGKSWKFNHDHEMLLIEHVFQTNKVAEARMTTFYRYIPYLKGFVRSRLWELTQDTKKKDIKAGAAAFSGNNRGRTGNEQKQTQYETEIAGFLNDEKRRQTTPSPEERLFDNIAFFRDKDFDSDFKKRLMERVRAEQVLEILADSELTVVKAVEYSGKAWRDSQRFQEGIYWVVGWKKEQNQPDTERRGRNHDGAGAQNSTNIHTDQLRVPRNNDTDQEPHLSAATIPDGESGRKEVRALARQQRTKKKGPETNQDASHSHNDGAIANMDEDCGEYELEKDVNAYLIQFKVKQETDKTNQHPEIFLESHEEPLTDGRFKGTFPDQRISMSLLLDSDILEASKTGNTPEEEQSDTEQIARNILSRNQCKSKDGTQKIRYFHIPSNNMEWVEKAIANYYETDKPNLTRKLRHQRVQTPTQLLLSPHYWRGQQQGTRSGVVHARHMRSLCEVVSTDMNEIEKHPKNIVLFMPYLHWETDRRRETISRLIDIESDKFRRKQRKEKQDNKKKRQKERLKLTEFSKNDIESRKIKHPKEDADESRNKLVDAVDLAIYQLFRRRREDKLSGRPYIDDSGRLIVLSALGQYLVDAARLYEAMSTFRDQRMLEKYLFHDPPLHPRRTLDQSYYWTLRTTKARDRDQVIYRDTKLDFIHKLQETGEPKRRLWTKLKRLSLPHSTGATSSATLPTTGDPVPLPGNNDPVQHTGDDVLMKWMHHTETTDEQGCDQCKSDIKKVSQLIMVDQLWMWVLDEHTIITSFPRRYGSNKHDLSGVHRSIRARLKSFRKNEVRSVYDLALIILDECSNTFFDRTRTDEGQPQVMDIFSEAIGRVTNQHTISFQHVWHWTQEASKIYRARSKYVSSADLHVSLLDINPEGKLQREVKDILDELDIMLHVHKRQRDIMKRFRRHVVHILDPKNRCNSEFDDEDRAESSRNSQLITRTKTEKKPYCEEPSMDEEEEEKRKKEQLAWFRVQYQELLSEVNDRIDELEGLRAGAKSTADSVNDLLALKQQQASVVQAWESVRQAEEAVTQGRAVMMFTIVTIVFLPLSFMSSIFGMNNFEFTGEGPMHLGEQFKLMFSISTGIIVATIVVAFSPLLRATVLSLSKLVFTIIVVYSGLYWLWIAFHDEWCSQSLMRKTELKVRELKEDVRKAKRKRAARLALLHEKNEQVRSENSTRDAQEATQTSWWSWLKVPGAKFNLANNHQATATLESIQGQTGENETCETRAEHHEQKGMGPSSMVSMDATQVNTDPRMLGGNTPVSYGANTPEPVLEPRGGGGNAADLV